MFRSYGFAIFGAGIVFSIAVHVGITMRLLNASASGDYGTVAIQTNAISVNLETTDIIDAADSANARAAASAPVGTAAETMPEIKKQDDAKPEPKPDKERLAREEADSERILEEAERLATKKEEADRTETKRLEAEAETRPIDEAQREAEKVDLQKHEKEQAAAVAGSLGAVGSDQSTASSGRVSASQGSMLSYGANLRAIISANTPRGVRKKRVRLAFSVAPSGGVEAVDIAQSSNDAKVDQTMRDLVMKLSPKFPPPPKGATKSQLTYNIEINFQ